MPRHRQSDGQLSPPLPPLPKLQVVWRRCVKLCCLPRCQSETSASAVSSSLKYRKYKDRFAVNMNIKSFIIFADSGCAHSDVRSLNMTIVEGPTECHKSRLDLRETGDGLTGSLDRIETVPKWSRERRAREGLRGASRRDKAMRL